MVAFLCANFILHITQGPKTYRLYHDKSKPNTWSTGVVLIYYINKNLAYIPIVSLIINLKISTTENLPCFNIFKTDVDAEKSTLTQAEIYTQLLWLLQCTTSWVSCVVH